MHKMGTECLACKRGMSFAVPSAKREDLSQLWPKCYLTISEFGFTVVLLKEVDPFLFFCYSFSCFITFIIMWAQQ